MLSSVFVQIGRSTVINVLQQEQVKCLPYLPMHTYTWMDQNKTSHLDHVWEENGKILSDLFWFGTLSHWLVLAMCFSNFAVSINHFCNAILVHRNTLMETQLMSSSHLRQHATDNIPYLQTMTSVHGSIPCRASRLLFIQFNILRRRENGSKLSPGQIANSISHQADIVFGSFQSPCVPTAMLADCYHTGLLTHILHSISAFLDQNSILGNKWMWDIARAQTKRQIRSYVGFI